MKSLYLYLEIPTGKLLGAFSGHRDLRSMDHLPEYSFPYLAIWPGFAINTIFYAALLWVLFCAPSKVRRLVRIRRGCCPACGYPVGTSDVCTECGNPVRAMSVQSP